MRQRERAVAARRGARGARIEHGEVEAGARQCARERGADGTGADDREIVHREAGARAARAQRRQAASTSATDFGVATVRLSWPSAVTSTSSSMRTPMFQKRSGTLSAGRM